MEPRCTSSAGASRRSLDATPGNLGSYPPSVKYYTPPPPQACGGRKKRINKKLFP